MALAVLPKVAPFCADRCLLPAGGSLMPAAACRPSVGRDFEATPSSQIEKSDNKFGNPEQASNRVHP
jgi:hypothetical protein